jgi:hypothetical protein
MQRSAISAFTRVFDALWLFAKRCAAEPGPSRTPPLGTVPVLRSSAEEALHRARDTVIFNRRSLL